MVTHGPGSSSPRSVFVPVTISRVRTVFYTVAIYLGDLNAILHRRIGKRILRRLSGRLTGRLLRRLFR